MCRLVLIFYFLLLEKIAGMCTDFLLLEEKSTWTEICKAWKINFSPASLADMMEF